MNEEEILEESDTSVSESSIEDEASSEDLSSDPASSEAVTETSLAYQDTVQYDINYNFGYMSIWFGAIFGVLCVIAFMKGFGND